MIQAVAAVGVKILVLVTLRHGQLLPRRQHLLHQFNHPVAKPHRHVIDQLRHLKTFQLPVAAMQRNQFFNFGHFFIGCETSSKTMLEFALKVILKHGIKPG